MDNTLYFSAFEGVNGKELWKTDGTAAGTVLAADIVPGNLSSVPQNLTAFKNQLYMSARIGGVYKFYKLDGLVPVMVKDIIPVNGNNGISAFAISNNTLVFAASNAASGTELWISDGTEGNTLQVAELNPGAAGSSPQKFTPGNKVFFTAQNGVIGSEIFVYDNTDGIAGLHKIYVNDNNTAGDQFTSAVGNNANQGTKATPVATIGYAVSIAQPNDTIVVDAGIFPEQVIVDKGITIVGAGQNLTSVISPSTTLIPAPGPFTEIALIETTQGIGDVHVRNISVTVSNSNPSQCIIIQSGGSVKNCKLLNGNQGVFFRVESAIKNAVLENNQINVPYIGVNCQGSGLTATLTNNVINANNPGFSAGVFAGLDFGPLVQLTVTGNLISDYATYGLLANSYNSNINQNSIMGLGGKAIERNSGNIPNATCNWYGTKEAELIASKIGGVINYIPWLTEGTDADASVIGFQPAANTCNGRQNKFYVNDNNQVGDVFTTAVGNNANNGFSSKPFATIEYAISIAQAGDFIFVDAGTHNLPDIGITKALTFVGPNYQTSPNNPADKLLGNVARNAEAIITGSTISILSNDLSFEGFTFDPGNKFAFALFNNATTSNDFGNFRYTKNILKIRTITNNSQFSLVGKFVASPASPVTSGYYFIDNRFEKITTVAGSTLQFAFIKNIEVTNNSFVTPRNTVRSQQAVLLGTAGLIDGLTFSNNTVDNASVAVGGNRIAGAVIKGNRIDNTDLAFNNAGTMPEASVIEISNNSMVNTTGGSPFMLYNRTGTSNPGTINTLTFENNVISGVPVPGRTGQLIGSINVTFNNSVLNPNVIIRGNKIAYSGDFSLIQSHNIRAISLRGNLAKVTVENNELTLDKTVEMLPIPSPAFVENPGITLNTEWSSNAYMPANAIINIKNNKMHGYRQSVAFYDGVNTGRTSYVGYGNIPTGAMVNINDNSFTGDAISINSGSVGEMINATCNWYGSAAYQAITSKVSEATVNNIPWLSSGTDNEDAATGFQPQTESCTGTPADADIVSAANITCNGAANGVIDVLVEEGVAPFSYAWSKDGVAGFSTTEDLANLSPGYYELVVTDANGSVDKVFVTITEPPVLINSISGTNVSCFGGNNGSATVIPSGGTLPNTFLWSNGGTTTTISNLAAGNYSVTITDANGCTTSNNHLVTQPMLLALAMSGNEAICNGTATATPSGGIAPYSYLWNNGLATQTINVPKGNYTVTVTDANGCKVTGTHAITGDSRLNPTVQIIDVNCFGGSDGSITITGSSGIAPFSYNINGSPFVSGNVFTGLTAGAYIIGVKDTNGCTDFVTKAVSQPDALVVLVSSIQPTCFGTSAGAINVSVSGGSGGLIYNWTGPNGFTSIQKNIKNLAAGSYTLVSTDCKECTSGLTAVVSLYNEVVVNAAVINIACRGTNNGAINLTLSGGTGAGFSFKWSNGAIAEDLVNLGNGNYTVVATDSLSGCTITRSFTITQPAAGLNVGAGRTNVIGCTSMGTITAGATGGTLPYQFSLNGTSYQTSASFTGLAGGNYTLWVKDANGCTNTKAVTITDNGTDEYEGNNAKNQSKPITIGNTVSARLALATDVADWFKFTTPAGVTATYSVTMLHPSVGYTYNVYPAANNSAALVPAGTSATSKSYTLAGNTTYYIQVTGPLSYNCYNLLVALPGVMTMANMSSEKDRMETMADNLTATAYPNPHQGTFNLHIVSAEDGIAEIEFYNSNGQKFLVRKAVVNKGSNLVPFMGIKYPVIMYRILVGKRMVSGKIIAAN